jgi:hypothetical protein
MFTNAMRQFLAPASACLAVAALVSTSSGSAAMQQELPPLFPIVHLANKVTATDLSGAAGTQKFFQLAVPAGQAILAFEMRGGTGNANLYLRLGSIPTLSNYNCRQTKPDNIETCAIDSPGAGTWFAMLAGQTAYSGVKLTGTFTEYGGSDPYLVDGTSVTEIFGSPNLIRFWRVAPGAGKTLLVRIQGGFGDADLYMRYGLRPTLHIFDCRPYRSGNAETCMITNTDAGDYYIGVHAYNSYSGLMLDASY